MIGRDRGVLSTLRARRPGCLHVIDPFKIPEDEAAAKARAVQRAGLPVLLLASTDYEAFDARMPAYVARVRASCDLPLVLHFPPRPGVGFPMTPSADAVLASSILNSSSDYFVWKAHLETMMTLGARGVPPDRFPEIILSAALTFGEDDKSRAAVQAAPAGEDVQALERYADLVRLLGVDLLYLYGRHRRVRPDVCRFFAERLRPDQLLFVSGGVSSREEIARYREAGADYVVFGRALECAGWRERLHEMVT